MSNRNRTQDKYTNVLNVSVTQSSANTLTFEEVDVGLNLFDRVGLLISRMEYYNNEEGELAANGDYIRMALTASNQITTISAQERAVIAMMEKQVIDHGTPASATLVHEPWVQDWSSLPGGGLLVAPKPLYVACSSAGLSAASRTDLRMFFTIIKLRDADYFELVESRRFFS